MHDLLLKGSQQLGIPLTEEKLSQMDKYARLLLDWNEKINLTAITKPDEVATKHFLDSLTPILTGKIKGSVIDVGTGAGFPGLVLKIACPDIRLTLLDSLNKRIRFLQEVTDKLGLCGVECVHMRAEDAGANSTWRAKFDVCVSRAVANMASLSELCLPFVKQDGYFLALKGPLADEELATSKKAVTILGGEVEDVCSADIPFTNLSHKIIMVKKVRQTPLQYPRKAGLPTKNPIG